MLIATNGVKFHPTPTRMVFHIWFEIERPGQWLWYNECYPIVGDKKIGGWLVPVRKVKRIPGLVINAAFWESEYNRLKEIKK